MRRIAIAVLSIASYVGVAQAEPVPLGQEPEASQAKKEPNPCSDQVAASLQKLRKSSWFRMNSNMLTENGPSTMEVDYILPDRMHQKVTNTLTKKSSEIILVGREAWSRQGEGSWTPMPANIAGQLQTQVQESVLAEQKDVGAYTCNGKTKIDGHDVMSYRLESELAKGETIKNQTYRMFYVDVMTGLPVSNALLVPGRDDKPVFKTSYTFPLDLKIEPPKDVVPPAPAASPAPAPAQGATSDTGK
ncbi:hypothetical protein HYPDE_30903 [Hyphomicrobium denitrificans 1NES1]|uniref:Uncharacterized protein n=1 Tax=Hyphomicrobium denitrificans 1NES1 TaxID=670307 RepID=N0BCK7_9HYPH|nr:hypothetical protein [Hyphomicrobium denitrificans]AGK57855.1 hypothetical protein HYPDE_30903 [Hyphomicrobium denitrificans 1NES1]